jgi:hypothetical protein
MSGIVHLRALRPLLLLAAVSLTCAQSLTAPPGYYPDQFNGDGFHGTLSSIDHDTITLTFEQGAKTEMFTGRFEAPCLVPEGSHPDKPMMAKDIPIGSELTAYYYSHSVKVAGKKAKENEIIAISIARWKDHTFPRERQGVIPCTRSKTLVFRGFR